MAFKNTKDVKEFVQGAKGDTVSSPKRNRKDEKKITVSLILTESQYHLISTKAKEESMPISTFIRSNILKFIKNS